MPLRHQAGLRAKQKRRFRPRTTGRRPLRPTAPNHLAGREAPPARPGEGWQADITHVAAKEGWLYVAGVSDACSRKVVGRAAADTMPTALIARACERAVLSGRPTPGLLHHSARRRQSASDACRELLRFHGAVASLSRAGNCYDHAKMESCWATMKTERDRWASVRHACGGKERDLLLQRGLQSTAGGSTAHSVSTPPWTLSTT